ncbi:phage holin family protein [Mucilaginibacter kameinonensis]|uniref:phage holin family protein n=1 Tax=Mucilaginibacter kameinonensis TaxID=452286 RepID=UPI000EF842BC|nr:phage holin family protein [Mucilaginibacter kameinonensis]
MKPILTLIYGFLQSFPALLKFIWANLAKLVIWTFCVYLLPTYELISLTLFLLAADMITGIWKSLKTGVPITAAKIGLTGEKMVGYVIGLIGCYSVQHVITHDLVKVMLFYCGIISLKELKSIIENIEVITNTPIWGELIKQVGSLFPKKDKKDNETN